MPSDTTTMALTLWLRLVALPIAATVVVVAGIWVTGGVVSDDFRVSMGATAAWFVLVAGGAVVGWRRRPELRIAAVTAVGVFVLVGGWLLVTSLRDKVVHEHLTAAPGLASGSFRSLAHETTGEARVVQRADGSSALQLVGLRTKAGPDLFVYLVPGSGDGKSVDGGTRVGRLKGNIGDQEYRLQRGIGAGRLTVVLWCRAFSVAFGAATLSLS